MPARLALIAFVLSSALPATAADRLPELVTTQNVVRKVQFHDDSLWINLGRDPDRYYIRFADPRTVLPIMQSLRDSSETGRSVRLKFRLDDAYVDAAGNPTFSVDTLEYKDQKWSGFARRARPKDLVTTPAELALARGIALVRGDPPQPGLRELDASLEANTLSDKLLPLALSARAKLLERLAYADTWEINDQDDALLVRAVDDARAAGALEPGKVDHLFELAYLYRGLGAHAEVFATLDVIEARFPDEKYRLAVRRGATYRQMGNYRAALKALDDYISEEGPQDGMMIHYHRAMTLNLLKRHAEAVWEVDLGLKDQPDYLWAFNERACGRAAQGKIAAALEDEKLALKMYVDMDATQPPSKIGKAQRARLEALVAQLEQAAREAPTTPLTAPCKDTHFQPAEGRRLRSALLPKS